MFIAWLGVALLAAPARAQIDYRNLDHGRPGAVEDAYPVERYGFEVSTGTRVHLGSEAGRYRIVQGLAYGLFRGGQVEVHLPLRDPDVAAFLESAGLRPEPGQEVDVQVSRALMPQLQLAAGYAHIFTGAFLKQATPGASYSYPYVMATYVFLAER